MTRGHKTQKTKKKTKWNRQRDEACRQIAENLSWPILRSLEAVTKRHNTQETKKKTKWNRQTHKAWRQIAENRSWPIGRSLKAVTRGHKFKSIPKSQERGQTRSEYQTMFVYLSILFFFYRLFFLFSFRLPSFQLLAFITVVSEPVWPCQLRLFRFR